MHFRLEPGPPLGMISSFIDTALRLFRDDQLPAQMVPPPGASPAPLRLALNPTKGVVDGPWRGRNWPGRSPPASDASWFVQELAVMPGPRLLSGAFEVVGERLMRGSMVG